MGLDVNIYVRTHNKNDFELLNERVKSIHAPSDLVLHFESKKGLLHKYERETDKSGHWSEINSLARYWGPYYERGPFWRIFTTLEWLRTQPEVCEILYGGDVNIEDAPEWTKAKADKYLSLYVMHGESGSYRPDYAKGRWEDHEKDSPNEGL